MSSLSLDPTSRLIAEYPCALLNCFSVSLNSNEKIACSSAELKTYFHGSCALRLLAIIQMIIPTISFPCLEYWGLILVGSYCFSDISWNLGSKECPAHLRRLLRTLHSVSCSSNYKALSASLWINQIASLLHLRGMPAQSNSYKVISQRNHFAEVLMFSFSSAYKLYQWSSIQT